MSQRTPPLPRNPMLRRPLFRAALAGACAAVLAWPGAGQAQPSQSQVGTIRQACRSDYMRRWCTRWMEGEMTPAPVRYATPRWQRTDFGRPVSSIRFRTVTPMAASACWAAKPRARSRGPISAL